jgi:2,5-diamino-6-(ribosylamino)-4(3H)-pyrimidinone 5'-phosphate reductase
MKKPYIICHMMISIDGRGGMPAVFDGLEMQHDVTPLKLIDVKKFDSDAVWIRYQCQK